METEGKRVNYGVLLKNQPTMGATLKDKKTLAALLMTRHAE